MTYELHPEIEANLDRSEESIEAAELLFSQGHFDFAVSRAYYAVFYAASAALLAQNLSFTKHSGVIAAVHKHFIRTGRLPSRFGSGINKLFELRNTGDYGGPYRIPEERARQALDSAAGISASLRALLG